MIGILIRFFRFSGDQKRNFYVSIVLSLFHAIFEAIRIPAIAVALTAIIENSMSTTTAWTTLGIMAVSIIGCTFTRKSLSIRQTIGGYTLGANKRVEIGERVKYMPMGYFNDNSLGYITAITTNTCESLQDVATRVIMITVQGLLTTIVITLAVAVYDWRIGLLIVIGIVVFLLVNSLMQKKLRKLSPVKSSSDSKLVSAVLEYIQGIGVIRSYNLDQNANKTVDKEIQENEDINLRMEKNFVPYMCVQGFALKLFGVLMILASIYFYLNSTMELITCLLMMISSFMVFNQLESAGTFSSLLRLMDLSMNKIDSIFETPIMDENGEKITPNSFEIKGEGVNFSYDKQKIIDNVDFKIKQGTTTAVVGPSGGGKTTLCHLMTRFWDVDSGKITLGGTDVRKYTLDSLLENYSMVF